MRPSDRGGQARRQGARRGDQRPGDLRPTIEHRDAPGQAGASRCRGGEPVWYTGDTSNMAPQVEEALEAYVDESHTKAMAILPLAKPTTLTALIEHRRETRQEFIGALIIEQITDEAFTQGMIRRIEVVRDHSASAMSNSIEHQNLFLMPLWRTLGKSKASSPREICPRL